MYFNELAQQKIISGEHTELPRRNVNLSFAAKTNGYAASLATRRVSIEGRVASVRESQGNSRHAL